MSRFFGTLLLVLLASTSAWAELWEWQNPQPQGNLLLRLAVASDGTLRGYGWNGLLAENTEDGAWSIYTGTPELRYIGDYFFLNDGRGWVVHSSSGMQEDWARILYTTDGGHTWTEQHELDDASLSDIFFVNGTHGWAVGDDRGGNGNVLLWTTDGGATWTNGTADTSVAVRSVFFLDTQEGWATAARTVLHTTDGGLTWEHWLVPPILENEDLQFTSSTTGWAIGYQGAHEDLFRTTDGGRTWIAQGLEGADWDELEDFAALDDGHVWVVGDSGRVWMTLDDGAHWSLQASGTISCLRDILFTDWQHGWICGENGTILRTTNGFDWNVYCGNPATESRTFFDLDFADTEHGWAADGSIWYTANSGETWNAAAPSGGQAWLLSVLDANHAWAAGNQLWHTTTGGQNWEVVSTGVETHYHRLQALSEQIVWTLTYASGEGYSIRRTTNGGESWITHTGIETGSAGEPVYFYAVDAEHAWICGWQDDTYGYVRRTTDGGATWSPHSGTIWTVEAIFFLDTQTGWVCGSTLYKTTDGGATWTEPENAPPGTLNGVQFFDAQNGWLLANERLYRTTDGGESWQHSDPYTELRLYALDFVDMQHGWAAGNHGALLHYDGTAGATPGSHPAQPAAYTLSASPNPFNPTARLTFTLPARGPVTLAVFDLTGRRVATLTDQVYEAGTHALTFDGSGLASGIYFAHLNAGSFAQVQKLVLLK